MKNYRLGITGGIGSGKTVVTRIFQSLGIPIYNADSEAKRLISNSPILKVQIENVFGPSAYMPNGTLNRIFIAEAIQSDSEKQLALNALVHPVVEQDFEDWARKSTLAPYLAKEAALLFEAGTNRHCTQVLNINAPIAIRIARTQARDSQRSLAQIESIIQKQLSDQERTNLADFNIDNDGKSLIIPQVIAIHKQILASLAR